MIPHLCTHSPSCFGCKVKTLHLRSPAFAPHYNYTVGKYVSTDAEFRDELKRASEANSEQTGLYHNYEPRYPGDTQPIRSADNILDDQAREITKCQT